MYETERLILEAVSDDAVKELYSFYNDYELLSGIENTADWVAPQTLEQLIEDTKGGAARFIVRLKKDDGSPGGVIGYASIGTNWIARVSEPLLYLGKEWHNQGLGKELLDRLLRIMFYEINARKCSITVFSFNAVAIKVYLAAGFTQEGRLREELYRKGDYYDVIKLGLLRTEYEKLKGGPLPMRISKEEYYFYEWLILGKGITEEQLKKLSPLEFNKLNAEYAEFKKTLKTF